MQLGDVLILGLCLAGLLMAVPAAEAQNESLTPKSLQAALAAKPQGKEAEALTARVRDYFGKENLLYQLRQDTCSIEPRLRLGILQVSRRT
jgi:hypothetical protein